MQTNRKFKTAREIKIIYLSKSRQERCNHRKGIKLYFFRRNFYFGKKSKARYSIKSLKGYRCVDCGKALDFKPRIVVAD